MCFSLWISILGVEEFLCVCLKHTMLTSHEMMVLGKAYQLLLGQYPLNKKREKRTKKRRILKFHFCHLPCQEEEMKLEVTVSRICKRWEGEAAAAQNSKQAARWMLGSCRHKTASASPAAKPSLQAVMQQRRCVCDGNLARPLLKSRWSLVQEFCSSLSPRAVLKTRCK